MRPLSSGLLAAPIIALLLIGSASAEAPSQAPTALSPRLAELAQPALRALAPRARAAALSLPASGAGSLIYRGNRVLVDVRFRHGAEAALGDLRAAGAEIVQLSRRLQTVTVAVAPADLPALAAVPRVLGVVEELAPLVQATCPSGAIVSEGDAQLRATAARAAFGVDGSGVTVGILSDSFDQSIGAATDAGEDVASGDLPGSGSPCGLTEPVFVGQEQASGTSTDEGRAMAQIVHDLAPGAAIEFASAANGELQFAANIRSLAAAGSEVIVDDVAYPDEPFFQDGPVAVAASQVSAAGVNYVSAVGNGNIFEDPPDETPIGSWETDAYRSTSCPAGLPSFATSCMDFDPGTEAGEEDSGFGIDVAGKQKLTVDLQWAQPWRGVSTDLDAYLLREGAVVAESQLPNVKPGFQEPFELLSWPNPEPGEAEVELVISRCDAVCNGGRVVKVPVDTVGGDGGSPRLKFELLQNGAGVESIEYPNSEGEDVVGPTAFGHASATAAIGVGAVPFFDGSEPEEYSSRGPAKRYFGPVIGPGAAPSIPAETSAKPDLAATDCNVTTFFAQFEPFDQRWHFCGTSAAAPHAAAVAALVRSANPGASGAQVRADLLATARPLAGFGVNQAGAGLIDAFAAVSALALPPSVPTPPPPPPIAPVDSTPPRTTIAKHPPKVLRTRKARAKAVFRFGSSEPNPTFVCKVDGRRRSCGATLTLNLVPGKHLVSVRARDQAGNLSSPATFSFRVKRVG